MTIISDLRFQIGTVWVKNQTGRRFQIEFQIADLTSACDRMLVEFARSSTRTRIEIGRRHFTGGLPACWQPPQGLIFVTAHQSAPSRGWRNSTEHRFLLVLPQRQMAGYANICRCGKIQTVSRLIKMTHAEGPHPLRHRMGACPVWMGPSKTSSKFSATCRAITRSRQASHRSKEANHRLMIRLLVMSKDENFENETVQSRKWWYGHESVRISDGVAELFDASSFLRQKDFRFRHFIFDFLPVPTFASASPTWNSASNVKTSKDVRENDSHSPQLSQKLLLIAIFSRSGFLPFYLLDLAFFPLLK